jgi:hypothetical protein
MARSTKGLAVDKRSIGNGVCEITGVISFFVIAGWIFKLGGRPWLSDLLSLANVDDIKINWDGVWVVVFVASIVGLITINVDYLRQWRQRRIMARHRDWDLNVCDAIDYITQSSMLGTAWPEKDRRTFATGALYEAAKTKKIKMAGLPKGSVLPVEIPSHWFNGTTVIDLKHCTARDKKAAFLLDSDQKSVGYDVLFVNRREIVTVWPSKSYSRI